MLCHFLLRQRGSLKVNSPEQLEGGLVGAQTRQGKLQKLRFVAPRLSSRLYFGAWLLVISLEPCHCSPLRTNRLPSWPTFVKGHTTRSLLPHLLLLLNPLRCSPLTPLIRPLPPSMWLSDRIQRPPLVSVLAFPRTPMVSRSHGSPNSDHSSTSLTQPFP